MISVIRLTCQVQVVHPSLLCYRFFFVLSVFREHQRRNSVRAPSPEHYCSDISPRSSPNSNHSSSTRDCESEPDQLPTPYEQVAKKKRKRTTFSLFEVRELERVFKRQPYLMPEDEEELVQRLGITARSLRVSKIFSTGQWSN